MTVEIRFFTGLSLNPAVVLPAALKVAPGQTLSDVRRRTAAAGSRADARRECPSGRSADPLPVGTLPSSSESLLRLSTATVANP
jgi:hypothetical protein